jgi:hypothetical protein
MVPVQRNRIDAEFRRAALVDLSLLDIPSINAPTSFAPGRNARLD